jgi:hypothetical protein
VRRQRITLRVIVATNGEVSTRRFVVDGEVSDQRETQPYVHAPRGEPPRRRRRRRRGT